MSDVEMVKDFLALGRGYRPSWQGLDVAGPQFWGGMELDRQTPAEEWQRRRGSSAIDRYLATGRHLNGSRNARARGRTPR